MKAQYPSALEKQCSKHSTQLGARTKPECVNTNLLRSPGAFPSQRDSPWNLKGKHRGGTGTPELLPESSPLVQETKKKTPFQIGLDRRGQKKQ